VADGKHGFESFGATTPFSATFCTSRAVMLRRGEDAKGQKRPGNPMEMATEGQDGDSVNAQDWILVISLASNRKRPSGGTPRSNVFGCRVRRHDVLILCGKGGGPIHNGPDRRDRYRRRAGWSGPRCRVDYVAPRTPFPFLFDLERKPGRVPFNEMADLWLRIGPMGCSSSRPGDADWPHLRPADPLAR
jgi:hypothetical protein